MPKMSESAEEKWKLDKRKQIGARLREFRKRAMLSQEEAAVLSYQKLVTLQRWERGEAEISLEAAARLAAICGFEVEMLTSEGEWADLEEQAVTPLPPRPVVVWVHPTLSMSSTMHEMRRAAENFLCWIFLDTATKEGVFKKSEIPHRHKKILREDADIFDRFLRAFKKHLDRLYGK